jgi:hypothetical protein
MRGNVEQESVESNFFHGVTARFAVTTFPAPSTRQVDALTTQ